MSAIKFDIQKFDDVINSGDRLEWTPFLPRAGWRKHYSEGEKSQDMKEKTWQELDEKALTAIQLYLADEV